jgi:hypothetical protein
LAPSASAATTTAATATKPRWLRPPILRYYASMTAETVHLIDLSDIVGIEFLCSHCGSRTLHVLGKFDRVPATCPNCHEGIVTHLGPEAVAIKEAVEAIQQLVKRKLPTRIRFQVTGFAEEKK